jgi:hypothetical protein
MLAVNKFAAIATASFLDPCEVTSDLLHVQKNAIAMLSAIITNVEDGISLLDAQSTVRTPTHLPARRSLQVS